MLDITITSKGIEKLLSNLNPHKAACPDQLKPITLKHLLTPLSPILIQMYIFSKSRLTREPYHQSGSMLYPLLVFFVKP